MQEKRMVDLRSWNGQPLPLIFLKSSLAILLCYLIAYGSNALTGAGLNTAFQAGIATMLCLKEDSPNTFMEAVNRSIGTILAGLWSYLFILFFTQVLKVAHGSFVFYLTDWLALLLLIAFLILIRRPAAIVCAVIVFLIATMLPVSVQNPFIYVSRRIIDTEIGIAVALFVNWLPPLNRYFAYHFQPQGNVRGGQQRRP